MDRYNGVASKAADEIAKHEPKKRDVMHNALSNFRDAGRDVGGLHNRPHDKEKIVEVIDTVADALDQVADSQARTVADDVIKGVAVNSTLLASLGALGDDDMDLGDLLGTAGELSDLLKGLVGNSTEVARSFGTNEDLTPASRAALGLDSYLTKLETGVDAGYGRGAAHGGRSYAPPAPSGNVKSLNPSVLDGHFQHVDLNKAESFEDVAAAVAYDIHQKAKATSAEGDAVASELQNLSTAARTGDRQKLLLAAKSGAALILAFSKQLTEQAKAMQCRTHGEKMEQDRMLKCAQELRDNATQLKILATVKAATIEDSRDTDATLTILTRNLGVLLSQGLAGMQFTQLMRK